MQDCVGKVPLYIILSALCLFKSISLITLLEVFAGLCLYTFVIAMHCQLSFISSFAFLSHLAVAVNNGWPSPYPDSGYMWQYTGNYKAGHWFDEFQGVLSTMQDTFFNGTAWPASIQWTSAFLDTLLAASDISLTNALVEYDGKVPGSHTRPKTIHNEIEKYFSQIEAFYGGENTIQIFGAVSLDYL